MPMYEFGCQQCGKDFTLALSIAEAERKRKEGFQCPECGSSNVVQQISHFQVKTSKKS
jgi:putative FmdB family regulatory protein